VNISNKTIILSAELSDKTFESNRQRTETLKHCLEDCNINFKEGVGVYKGKEEVCFVTVPKNDDEIQSIKEFAFLNFNQEAVLETDANSEAYLVFQNGTEERIGRLTNVPKNEAIVQDNYTILNGEYFITKQR